MCTPTDALRTSYASGIDALVMGDFLLEKSVELDPLSLAPKGESRQTGARSAARL